MQQSALNTNVTNWASNIAGKATHQLGKMCSAKCWARFGAIPEIVAHTFRIGCKDVKISYPRHVQVLACVISQKLIQAACFLWTMRLQPIAKPTSTKCQSDQVAQTTITGTTLRDGCGSKSTVRGLRTY